ncbi:hypothetical protein PG993_013981 [Apiospora rasikravindrae]|uniref:Eisosome protein 1 n=1 Tax=Apiospora rasikravindrae TaxID=990691 RepID=A0ABR1RRQ7_9PEZI
MQVQQTHDDTSTIPAGHHGRLVYAQPRDLPSYPSIGLAPNGSAASAAASLGWQSKKSPEIWTPDRSASASAAAVLAKDHKMATAWAPKPSDHGAQAALLAHKAATRSAENVKPSATDHGHTAATSAFNADRTSRRNPHASVPIDRQRSLVAAQGAMAPPTTTRRSRASTLPSAAKKQDTYPDESNAAANALKAATAAHKPKASAASKETAGATPFVQMNRQMFTSKPPVQPVVDEQRREDMLHASALAMAKKMFDQQQKVIDQTKKTQSQRAAAPHSRRRRSSSLSDDDQAPPMQFNSLQDAAYKAAQARLAKLEIDMSSRNYKDYYGQGQSPRRTNMRGKLTRRRSSSEGDIHNDRERSEQIRRQMSIFNTKVSQVDQQKRQQDRDALMAAAQRNVSARLKGMDDKIAKETGMIPPSKKTSWDSKAHAAAQLRSDDRLSKHGKIDLGAGKYMEQEDIDAIAASRVQPVIDEINERAEQEHARLTEQKLEEERQKEERELERQREQEVNDINKKLKEQEKYEAKERRQEEKAEAKAKKEEEKAARAEQKRLAKEEKRKSAAVAVTAPTETAAPHEEEIAPIERVELNDAGQPVRVPAAPPPATITTPESPTEAVTITRADHDIDMPDASAIRKHRTKSSASSGDKSPTIRVRSWFKSHFHRGSKSDVEQQENNTTTKPKEKGKRQFIGGAALTSSQNGSTASVNNARSSNSVHAVAMAGRQSSQQQQQQDVFSSSSPGHSLAPSVSLPNPEAVSPMSSSSEDEYFHDVAPVISHSSTNGAGGLSPPRPIGDPASRKSHSPNRDSRFLEII